MKTKSVILFLCLSMIQNLPAAEEFKEPEEVIVASNRPPIFGMLDGVEFEQRTVDRVTSEYHVYVCHRARRPADFKIGQRIEYGDLGPVGDNYPDKVIDRIILNVPIGEGYARSFFEFPVELVRDVTQPSVGPSKAGFSLVRKGAQITVFLQGGDGAYSYVANWHIDLETNRVRRVAANGERDEAVSTPWHDLKKIDPPKIINTPDKGSVAPIGDPGSQQDAMAIIRHQLALALSENKDQASLADALAACRRLAAPSFIIDLLSDPKYGWKRMAPTTLCHNDDSRTFVIFTYRVHEALFERWGELDLDGALKRLPPPVGQDFDEGMVITFNLYKGAASAGNGKDVFERLIPPSSEGDGYGEHQACALRYLMEGWARSDPDAAWITLVSHPSMGNAGRDAIRGYFKGLDTRTHWEKLARKVEGYCAKDEFIAGVKAKGEFRRSLASAWLRQDPAAALNWFAANCNDPHPNFSGKGDDVPVVVHAVIITEWLEYDLAGAIRWLATWKSDRISTAKVIASIAARQRTLPALNANPKLLEAIENLIRERSD